MIEKKSYAKINLLLDIIGRKDGYHIIETVFQKINFYDKLSLTKIKKGLAFDTNIDSIKNNNSIYSAYKYLCDYLGKDLGVKIFLQKNIPLGGGLGGASSNAATFLLGVDELYGLSIPKAILLDIAEKIGMDTPFFLEDINIARGSNYGELISQLDRVHLSDITLIIPNISVSTKYAYSLVDPKLCHKNKELTKKFYKNYAKKDIIKYLHNDFEIFIYKEYPTLKVLYDYFSQYGKVVLSGSGSTMVLYKKYKPLNLSGIERSFSIINTSFL